MRIVVDELLDAGETLIVDIDIADDMGRDSDDPLSEGEVGKCGVAVDTLADMSKPLQILPDADKRAVVEYLKRF